MVHVNTDEDPSGWRPCFTFLETLEEKCLKTEDVQGMLYVHLDIVRLFNQNPANECSPT